MTTKLSTQEAVRLFNRTNGRFFSVTFRKRTTGEERTMVARLGVHKFLKGGSLKFDPKNVGLMTVFDVQKMDYRMINLRDLISIRSDKQAFEVEK